MEYEWLVTIFGIIFGSSGFLITLLTSMKYNRKVDNGDGKKKVNVVTLSNSISDISKKMDEIYNENKRMNDNQDEKIKILSDKLDNNIELCKEKFDLIEQKFDNLKR